MKVRFFFIIINIVEMFSVAGCSGYHFNINNNPLIGYDVKSISIPMFINYSVLPQLSAPLTREITLTLSEYSGLRVFGGDNKEADAVLIGIIDSRDHYTEVVTALKSSFTEGDILTSIGKRNPFYYPSLTAYSFTLKLMLIKRPTQEELKLFTGGNGAIQFLHPKIVMEKTIDISGSFSRITNETFSNTAAGEVNFVKNKGLLEKNIMETSYQAAQTFRQVILNAF